VASREPDHRSDKDERSGGSIRLRPVPTLHKSTTKKRGRKSRLERGPQGK